MCILVSVWCALCARVFACVRLQCMSVIVSGGMTGIEVYISEYNVTQVFFFVLDILWNYYCSSSSLFTQVYSPKFIQP